MTWASDVQALSAEAGGIMDVSPVGRAEFPHLLAASQAGDATATVILGAINDMIGRVVEAPRGRPLLCLCCPRSLRRARFTCGVVMPDRPDATKALGFGICDRCGPTTEGALPKVLEALRRTWPGMRTVQHAPGHA